MSNVRVVKLITGEELLCTLVAETEKHVELRNALLCAPQGQDPVTKKIQFGIMPYISMAKEDTTFRFKQEHVMYVTEADTNAEAHHDRIFNVIQAPTKGLVIAR